MRDDYHDPHRAPHKKEPENNGTKSRQNKEEDCAIIAGLNDFLEFP